jgi:geranylgeranyl diphosphate synthase type 3
MNLESTEYGDNKGYCEDLTEGKFSFPVVHAVRASEDDRQILSELAKYRLSLEYRSLTFTDLASDILQKRTQDNALKAHAVRIMRERTGSFRYTRRVLQQLQEQVQTEISKLGGNELLVKIVKALQVPLEEGDEVSA